MTQTAASLDALIAKPRTTPLENEDGAALTDCRVQLFGPVTAPPPPPPGPPPAVDYTVPPSLWTFGAKGSAGGNYRLENIPCRSKIRVAFTTDSVINSFGRKNGGAVNLQWSSGTAPVHTMTCEGKVVTSPTPAIAFATVNPASSRVTLQAFTQYVIEIDTPASGLAGTYHLNFQNSPY